MFSALAICVYDVTPSVSIVNNKCFPFLFVSALCSYGSSSTISFMSFKLDGNLTSDGNSGSNTNKGKRQTADVLKDFRNDATKLMESLWLFY